MRKDNLVYTILLSLGLVFAYMASQPEDIANIDKVKVLEIDKTAIDSMHLRRGESDVLAVRRASDKTQFWITSNFTKGEKVTTKEFLASRRIKKVISSFQPLYADRMLGEFNKGLREKYGFSDKPDVLEIFNSDKKLLVSLEFGRKSYGTGKVYATVNNGDQLYLIDGAQFQNLQNAFIRLKETKTFVLDKTISLELTIQSIENSKQLFFSAKEGKENNIWSYEKDGKASKEVASWITKFEKVRIGRYATPEEKKKYKSEKAILTVAYANEKIRVKKFISMNEKTQKEELHFWLDSKFLDHPVLVGDVRMENLIKDFELL